MVYYNRAYSAETISYGQLQDIIQSTMVSKKNPKNKPRKKGETNGEHIAAGPHKPSPSPTASDIVVNPKQEKESLEEKDLNMLQLRPVWRIQGLRWHMGVVSKPEKKNL